jgi:FG-GAP-like repeat
MRAPRMREASSAPGRAIVAACVAVAALAGGSASHLAAQPTPPGPGQSAMAENAPRAAEPTDGRWLIDQHGRQYYSLDVPRREKTYAWVTDDHTRVRLWHGLEWDVLSYDDNHFRVKVYRPAADDAPVARRRQVTSEELDRVAAGYRVHATPGSGLELRAFSAGLPQRGQWRNDFDVADVNRDGHPDIVFGPSRKSVRRLPTIFLGDGSGNWKPWSGVTFPSLPFDYGDAKIADLNGDGVPDLVLASHLRGIAAMVGNGLGRFTAWSDGIEFSPASSGQAAFSSRAIAIADWNGDGRPDILALGEGPSPTGRAPAGGAPGFQAGSRGTIVYLNNGNGTWTKIAGQRSRNFGGVIVVADFDRDGRMDFATGSDGWGFTALLNLGQADGTWKETSIPGLRPDGVYRAVATADFDGDGRPDLAVSFQTREHGIFRTGIDVLLNRSTGWERRTLGVVEDRVGIFRLATGDLDGDGHADMVGVDGHGGLWVFRGDGKGAFAREPVPEMKRGEQCQGYGLRLVDLDRDGADEIVVSFAAESGARGPYSHEQACPTEGALQAWKVVHKGKDRS